MNLLSEIQTVHLFPIFTVVLILLFFIYYLKAIRPKAGTTEWIEMEIETPSRTFLLPRHKMSEHDILPLALISAVFFLLAIFNLGDTNVVDVLYEVENPREVRTHNDSMYFDEIFFVRTAVEHIEHAQTPGEIINDARIFEWTHPPLGKDIIAASILTAGMTPFGWRLFGALFGVLMLLVMYVFIKNMFGRTAVAACGTLLFGFEFMRFVQSRIGTIDIFLVFFILTSFFFMYRYVTVDGDARFSKSLLPLALSGIFFGLGVAIKWVGFYAGAGLFVIYIIRQVKLYFHYKDNDIEGFGKYFTKTLLFSFLFFVIIPALVYYVTYIPYGHAWGLTVSGGMLWDPWFFTVVWHNQTSMLSYHYHLVAEHPFTSVWWQWILNIRPILFVNDHVDGLRATFGSFGNPVVYWGGLVAILVMGVRIFTRRDDKSLFIVVGYLCGLLPWMFVSRILFAYHYFPSSLFLILALCHVFNHILEQKRKHSKSFVYGFTVLAGLIFAIFYPSLSGMFMPNWYYENFIRWLPSWPF